MSILDPDSDIAAIARRDLNARTSLPALIQVCAHDKPNDNETKEEMFARRAYAIADAMERQRTPEPPE